MLFIKLSRLFITLLLSITTQVFSIMLAMSFCPHFPANAIGKFLSPSLTAIVLGAVLYAAVTSALNGGW